MGQHPPAVLDVRRCQHGSPGRNRARRRKRRQGEGPPTVALTAITLEAERMVAVGFDAAAKRKSRLAVPARLTQLPIGSGVGKS
jgi:hypothetical protein